MLGSWDSILGCWDLILGCQDSILGCWDLRFELWFWKYFFRLNAKQYFDLNFHKMFCFAYQIYLAGVFYPVLWVHLNIVIHLS